MSGECKVVRLNTITPDHDKTNVRHLLQLPRITYTVIQTILNLNMHACVHFIFRSHPSNISINK